MTHSVVAATAALAALVATGALLPVLQRRLLDVPNHRSSHVRPVPRGGGLALLTGVAAGTFLWVAEGRGLGLASAVVAAALGLGIVGMLDDVRSLRTRTRLVAQLLAAVVVVVAVVAEPVVPPLVLLGPLAVVGYVSYVNAFNFMDGVNGISAASGAVCGAWFWWLGSQQPAGLTAVAAALAGACLGFLPWNAGGRVFLGDVGSYGVGALIAGMTVCSWAAGTPAILALAPLLVYLADTGTAILRRARNGERLGDAHRDHVYQRLVDGGWPHLAAALWCAGASVLVCLALAVGGGTSPAAVAVATGVVGTYLLTPAVALRTTWGRVVP